MDKDKRSGLLLGLLIVGVLVVGTAIIASSSKPATRTRSRRVLQVEKLPRGWENEERTTIVRDERGFIVERIVHRVVKELG